MFHIDTTMKCAIRFFCLIKRVKAISRGLSLKTSKRLGEFYEFLRKHDFISRYFHCHFLAEKVAGQFLVKKAFKRDEVDLLK